MSQDELQQLVQFFKVLGDETRLRMVGLLANREQSVEELAAGYEYCYRRTFSHRCIWRRRPGDWRAVPAYVLMAYLYKRSNWLWPLLIRRRLTHWTWRPLLEVSRWRHLRFRRRLEERGEVRTRPGVPVTAGV